MYKLLIINTLYNFKRFSYKKLLGAAHRNIGCYVTVRCTSGKRVRSFCYKYYGALHLEIFTRKPFITLCVLCACVLKKNDLFIIYSLLIFCKIRKNYVIFIQFLLNFYSLRLKSH